MKAIQERMRYLQSQQHAANSNTTSLNTGGTPMSPHYQRPLLYNSGSAATYGHQPMMQPQPVHYNPPNQQPPPTQDSIAPSQQNINSGSVNVPASEGTAVVQEPVIYLYITKLLFIYSEFIS